MSLMTLDFRPMPLSAWDDLFARVPRSNLLQSYPYAQAVARTAGGRPRWAVIRDVSGTAMGLMQAIEVRALGGMVHGLMIDRGPLWLPGFGAAEDHQAFWTSIARRYPRRWGRRRRFIPEWEWQADSADFLTTIGLQTVPANSSYQTYWLDLQLAEEERRARLAANWRNHLAQAERQHLSVRVHRDAPSLAQIVRAVAADQHARGYPGPELPLLMALVQAFAVHGDALGVEVTDDDGGVHAAGLFFCHGTAATWQAGVVTSLGRESCANYLMLWQACWALAARNIAWLDLGGVNDQDAKGIKDFKQGMGGEHHHILGQYA